MFGLKNALALLFAAIVSSQGARSLDRSQDVTFGEIADTISSGLLEIQATLFDIGYNAGGVVGGKLVDSLPCRPEADEDEDACRNITEMIRSRGFEVENYEVTSEDGYILSIQRVINPLVDEENRSRMKPVILQHGLLSSAVDWVFNSQYARPASWPPEQQSQGSNKAVNDSIEASESVSEEEEDRRHPRSLAFYLANRGYDVFLPNLRGSKYSLKHVSKSPIDPLYWRFTLDEQIDYDVPAIIKFVQQTTGYEKISYVGWSEGSTIMFGLMSDQPEYADIIEPYIVYAPVAYVHHIKSPITPILPLVPSLQNLNTGFAFSDAFRYSLKKICGPSEVQTLACLTLGNLAYGDDSKEFDIHRLRTLVHHFPAGSSFKTIAHYAQNILSRKFARFNYGLLGNKKKYGTLFPPEYNLTNIRSESMFLFTADNDFLADPEDVRLLVSQLGVKPVKQFDMTEDDPNWNHMAYVYHKKAGILINPQVAHILDQYNKS